MAIVPEPAGRTTSPPATVVVAAVLAFAEAALLLVGVADVLLTVGRLSLGRPGSLSSATLVGLLGAAVLLPLALAVLGAVAGVGLLRGRRGARMLLCVVCGVVLAQAVVGVAAVLGRSGSVSPLVGVSLALTVAVLVLLALPASRAWFTLRPR